MTAGTALVAGVALFGAPAASAANGATPQRIGQAPAVPHGAVAIAAPAASQPLQLSVALNPRNTGALNAFVTAVSTKGSPEYHHYLSKGQFAAVFGPTQATIDAVTSALSAAGLHPDAVSADGLSIPVHTTVGQAARAFGTSFAGYRLSDGRITYANTAAPQLPSSVAGAVTGVVGLNNFTAQTAQHTAARHVAGSSAGAGLRPNTVAPNSPTPTICAGLQQALTNAGLTDTQNYWEPGTLSQSYAYNTSPLYGQYGNTGYGVTVGIFELENYSTTDIADYQSCFGTHASVSAIKVDGGPTQPVSLSAQTGLESALDIETVAGLAPNSTIKVYQGPDATNATDTNVLDTYQQMVTEDAAQVISTSWGTCELDQIDFDKPFFGAEANIFAEAAAQGQTVLAASGDTGSTGCFQNPNSTHRGQLSADDPASQVDVTAVGGTTMTGISGAESTWNSNGGASGGGVSAVESLSGSANYQHGVTGAGYSDACQAASGATCRQVPDVAALADPNDGYLVSWVQNDPNGGWFIIGGTSGAAPLWAAIAALADSSTACAANGQVGLINPALYSDGGSAWKDIAEGNNDVTASGYTGGLYAAGGGYDMATGLGSPHAPQLVEALCAAPKPSGGSSFTAAGPTRLLDTRNGTGAPQAPVGANSHISLQVAGVAGVPASGVTAVVLNVTVTNATAASFLTVYPDGTPRPASSNLNWVAGETIPNLVTVPVGADGAVDLYNFQGNVDLVADLFGYYSANGASKFQPMSPTRVLDTRNGTGWEGALGANGEIILPVAGRTGVPSSGVTAVVLNVTVTDTTAASFLTVFPDGPTKPVASNLNWVAGETVPNLVTVPVGSDGNVDFYNFQGSTDVVADIFGYYTNSGSGFVFHPSAPHRLADTRSGIGVAPGQPTPVGANGVFQVPLGDEFGPGNNGPLSSAAALVLNVTATQPTLSGYVTVYPTLVHRPLASNLNFTANETIPNSVVTEGDPNGIDFYNFQGTVQLVVDLFGYFATS